MTITFGLRDTAEQITFLRARLLATRWPSYDSRDGWSLGTSSDDAKRLAKHWATQFDFDSLSQRLAGQPHEYVTIDDVTVQIDVIKQDQPESVPFGFTGTLAAARAIAVFNRAYWRMLFKMNGWGRTA